ncbi:ADP-ribosylglycohydrolase family protein [Streptacidiphilus carbonis]|uniref:ADP-ribosylglycohydrolase family protein n=1 Tax=Streptacidiphilus carbonis TaxID=105422 RepID=UPI0005A973E0
MLSGVVLGVRGATAEGLGDVDTTCAITGGVVAARTGLDGVPEAWRMRREALPVWVDNIGPEVDAR